MQKTIFLVKLNVHYLQLKSNLNLFQKRGYTYIYILSLYAIPPLLIFKKIQNIKQLCFYSN